jgi:two-component system LytT family response regulator
MKIYSAIIVDDDHLIREGLALVLEQRCNSIYLTGTAATGKEARKLLKDNQVDLIFLDISMPEEDGFSFLASIEASRYAIIFITAFQEFAIEAFKHNAIDYLLKPIDEDELIRSVSKAIDYLELRRSKQHMLRKYAASIDQLLLQIRNNGGCMDKITIPGQFGFRIVEVKDIMYLEANGNYTHVYFSDKNKSVVSKALGDFEKMLDGYGFFRIHKSIIINLRYLVGYSNFEGNFAEMTDGSQHIISRRKLGEFREAVSNISKNIV